MDKGGIILWVGLALLALLVFYLGGKEALWVFLGIFLYLILVLIGMGAGGYDMLSEAAKDRNYVALIFWVLFILLVPVVAFAVYIWVLQ